MWNFSFVVPSFLILIIFLGYYFFTPRISIRINRLFFYLIATELVVITFDIISSTVDNNYQLHSDGFLYFANSAFFVAFYVGGVLFFVFTTLIIQYDYRKNIIVKAISFIPALVAIGLVLTTQWTHKYYYIDDTGYHSGPLYKIIYVVSVFYIVYSLALAYMYRDRFRNYREKHSTFSFNMCLLLGIICRYLVPKLLPMDTFCLMAVIIIYLSFENPNFFLEGRTDLFNSLALRSYLSEINGNRRYRIVAVTIHNYSEVREMYGAKQMDRGIYLIGRFLKSNFPKQKIFYYRRGRFAIIFEDNSKIGNINELVQERFKAPWQSDDVDIYVEAGVAVLEPGEGAKHGIERIMQLLIATFVLADSSDGTHMVSVDEDYAQKIKEESDIKKTLTRSLENDEVEVFFQPIISSSTGEIVGAEALSRIRDKNGNIIPPGLFIPIAERNGKINRLGEIVFTGVCQFLKDYDISRYGLSWVNVNLSPTQFMRLDLAQKFDATIRDTGIDPSLIHLEITEETMVDEQLLLRQITNLQRSGFCFVLDDYGKGYSNMSRMKQCPFVNIKLDMSIVWDYCDAPDEMLPNMVKTFKSMGFEITAEGIENEEMAGKMSRIGCDYLQGYYYSKPVPMEEFMMLLRKAE